MLYGCLTHLVKTVHPHRAEGTMWIVCVGDAPVVVNPTLSIGDTMFIFQIILVKNCYNLEENY